ncbi:Gfo/Idh/MocA family oxidoreductase [Phycicoccus sp.]|uniref:Gfo/Idh/MocA family protein n=1 Tax=Phycicoccus sp. TaxID=1902410 RepID=UPI002C1C6078|nr:Gfo/Idh/MocA family oxidoreductase [Phycicoccus sp.]HMM96941.1 Gfo/Idh/MocA family oxidoreductase [Phycicoccus sp.]
MSPTEVRVGVVGVGIMGTDHAERLASRIAGARLVAVADPDRVRATALADRLGTEVLADPLALVASPDVDAVVLASPGFAHEEQVLACLAARKPVLCEKPLTMDDESSLRVVRAEVEHGARLVTVGFMRRFDPEYAEARALLGTGERGRLLLLHNVHRNRSVPNADFRSEMIVRDSLVHEVDSSRFLFDDEVVEVTVLAPAPTRHAAEGVLDPQVALFRMAGGGLVTNEVFVNSQVGYEVRFEAVAERGSLTAGLHTTALLGTSAAAGGGAWGGVVPADYRRRFARAYDLEVQAWVDGIRAGTGAVGASAWDGYAATAVSTAGMASLATGTPVAVELAERPSLYRATADPVAVP